MFLHGKSWRVMPRQSSKVVSIRRRARPAGEADELADSAYAVWLANGFRGCSPEEALFTAVLHMGREAAGPCLVPKHNAVRPNIYPLCGAAPK